MAVSSTRPLGVRRRHDRDRRPIQTSGRPTTPRPGRLGGPNSAPGTATGATTPEADRHRETSEAAALNAVTGLTRERVRALDLAAGLAVFFMILVHVLWHWGAPGTWTTPIGQAISYAAGPTAAPVFTFLMGVSIGAAARVGHGNARRPRAVAGPAGLRPQLPARRDPGLARSGDRGHHARAGRAVHALVAGHDGRSPPRHRPLDGRHRDPADPIATRLAVAGSGRRAGPRGSLAPAGRVRHPDPGRAAHPGPRLGPERLLRGRALAHVSARRCVLRRDPRPGARSDGGLPPGTRPWASCSSSSVVC